MGSKRIGHAPTQLKRAILRWYRAFGRHDFPWRGRHDPWQVLLGELMLQRTRADLVAPVYEKVLDRWPTACALASAAPGDVQQVLRPLGFHHRNLRLQATASACAQQVPQTMDGLLALPGVGPYAAKATLCFAFGRRLAIVDPSVIRVLDRWGVKSSDRARPRDDPKLWAAAEAILPARNSREWNYAILDFGSLVCKSRPDCANCPARRWCPTGKRVLDRRGTTIALQRS